MPSGRTIYYPYPRIAEETRVFTNADGTRREVVTRKMVYEGEHTKTRKWTELRAYGGLLAENVTQAASRDVLVDAMTRLESAGLPVILHVHDEVVCEVPSTADYAQFCDLMRRVPTWCADLPIATDGWNGARYRK